MNKIQVVNTQTFIYHYVFTFIVFLNALFLEKNPIKTSLHTRIL